MRHFRASKCLVLQSHLCVGSDARANDDGKHGEILPRPSVFQFLLFTLDLKQNLFHILLCFSGPDYGQEG
jgi:hypothetical protein